jgi:diketogulonate reductase-like aldo/keto reductase
MCKERDDGRTRFLGVSNVSLHHFEQMVAAGAELPTVVQNRCFARLGWDRDVRMFCKERKIVYQGFSLLTANPEVVQHPMIRDIADRAHVTSAQVLFSLAHRIGILPLTGTSNAEHMRQDLASRALALSPQIVQAIDLLAT